jgi:serine/threonine protein phosphatase PrpC
MQVTGVLKAAAHSHPGLLRGVNEDRFHYDAARGLFIVVDGVGGQAAGEKAAETALSMLRARLERETGTLEDRVREAIALANNEIHRLASLRPEWRGMACVLTIAAVADGEVVIGHVGDTRLYKLRAGRIAKLTLDHSPVGEREDAGELPELEAMQHPRRNEVYRDVGSEHHEPDDSAFIDIVRAPFEPDAALLLCSDGLTDAVPSAAINGIVEEFAGHPYEIVHALVDAANDAGGKDNVTVVYVENARFVQGEDTRGFRWQRPVEPLSDAVPLAAPPSEAPVRRRGQWRVATLIVLLTAVSGAGLYWQRDRLGVAPSLPGSAAPERLIVAAGGSISAAIARAQPGSEVIVEPGEYREQLRLKDGVRVISRVSRKAVLRLPGGAAETEAAVTAFEIADAWLSGFRIVGDAATPLGIGVIVRNADVTISDVEIAGAHIAAVQYDHGTGGSLVAAYIHDNPSIAVSVRSAATPRIAHSVFERNATSERAAGTVLVESDARPSLTANTFLGVRPESIVLPTPEAAEALKRENWFIGIADRRTTPARQPARGRQ